MTDDRRCRSAQPPAKGWQPCRAALSRHHTGAAPRGFTLVELLVVISLILLLTVMTIGAINLSVTSERVRSGARQVQSVLEGARDRAIYAGAPRGVRLLVNEDILEDHDANATTPPISTLATTLVYIGSPGKDESEEDRDDLNDNTIVDELRKYVQFPDPAALAAGGVPAGEPLHRAIIGTNTNWTDLYERGLIGPESFIVITDPSTGATCKYKIDPRSFPIKTERSAFVSGGYGGLMGSGFNVLGANGVNPFRPNPTPPPPIAPGATEDEILYLLYTDNCLPAVTPTPVPNRPWQTETREYSIELSPDILPGEDPSILPGNVCIDLETSHLPSGWVTYNPSTNSRQFSNRMDILFSPGGGVIGDAAAAGLIHLHVCDVGDALLNVPPGSQTLDGTPAGDERNGDEFGITVFTRSGRTNTHPINWDSYPVPGSEFRNFTFVDAADFDGNPATKGYWQASASYAVGDIVAPTLYNGNIYRCVATSGSAGAGEPNWNPAPGGRTVDNNVTWVAVKHNVWDLGEQGEVAQ